MIITAYRSLNNIILDKILETKTKYGNQYKYFTLRMDAPGFENGQVLDFDSSGGLGNRVGTNFGFRNVISELKVIENFIKKGNNRNLALQIVELLDSLGILSENITTFKTMPLTYLTSLIVSKIITAILTKRITWTILKKLIKAKIPEADVALRNIDAYENLIINEGVSGINVSFNNVKDIKKAISLFLDVYAGVVPKYTQLYIMGSNKESRNLMRDAGELKIIKPTILAQIDIKGYNNSNPLNSDATITKENFEKYGNRIKKIVYKQVLILRKLSEESSNPKIKQLFKELSRDLLSKYNELSNNPGGVLDLIVFILFPTYMKYYKSFYDQYEDNRYHMKDLTKDSLDENIEVLSLIKFKFFLGKNFYKDALSTIISNLSKEFKDPEYSKMLKDHADLKDYRNRLFWYFKSREYLPLNLTVKFVEYMTDLMFKKVNHTDFDWKNKVSTDLLSLKNKFKDTYQGIKDFAKLDKLNRLLVDMKELKNFKTPIHGSLNKNLQLIIFK